MASFAQHWTTVWSDADPARTSWHQTDPEPSLSLVRALVGPGEAVVDVGGGLSYLGVRLATLGLKVTVVEIAEPACARLRDRLATDGVDAEVRCDDARSVRLPGPVAVWHDRAVLHFLTDPADVTAYSTAMTAAVRPGGHAVIGAFAIGGPTTCSRLPVQQYDSSGLAAAMGSAFSVIDSVDHAHTTPVGSVQAFTFTTLRRK